MYGPSGLFKFSLSQINSVLLLTEFLYASFKTNFCLSFFRFAVESANEEIQLIADKFKNYNKNIRPARHPEEKVKVQVKLTLTNLISLVTNLPAKSDK